MTKFETRQHRYFQGCIAFGILLIFAVYESSTQSLSGWFAGFALVACAACLIQMLQKRDCAGQAKRRMDLYESGLARVRGEAVQTGQTGDAFLPGEHIYAHDLHVLGADSLFGMLATTRTAMGQKALASSLLHAVDADTANARQRAVRELAPMTGLRERISLLGRFAFEDIPADSFEAWLDIAGPKLPRWLYIVLPFLSMLWMAVLFIGIRMHWDWPLIARNVLAVLAIQGLLCLKPRDRVRQELEAANRLGGQVALLRQGMEVFRSLTFESPLLTTLQKSVDGEDRALLQLERQLILVEQRTKEWFYPACLVLCLGTLTAWRLQAWKAKHGAAMQRWLDAWGHFDALVAVATYAAEHEKNVWPGIVTQTPTHVAYMVAKDLRHPLLPRTKAVANDVRLDSETQLLLISGSNMAGKSTLLRAIGDNVVLALAGAPVVASEMTLCALTTAASIAITDSLSSGKSKFLAELERLKGMVTLARENPGRMLFLIDEVLSGTNSLDRKAAAESVLRSLVSAGAVGAMSTHDLALAELAEITLLHGRNVHMASPLEEDPLAFDYLLKEGTNRTTNAMAIVRMLGLG